jgi:hypothetical protein
MMSVVYAECRGTRLIIKSEEKQSVYSKEILTIIFCHRFKQYLITGATITFYGWLSISKASAFKEIL